MAPLGCDGYLSVFSASKGAWLWSREPTSTLGTVTCACNLSTGKTETGRCLGLDGQPTQMKRQVSGQWETPDHKVKSTWRISEIDFWIPKAHICAQAPAAPKNRQTDRQKPYRNRNCPCCHKPLLVVDAHSLSWQRWSRASFHVNIQRLLHLKSLPEAAFQAAGVSEPWAPTATACQLLQGLKPDPQPGNT